METAIFEVANVSVDVRVINDSPPMDSKPGPVRLLSNGMLISTYGNETAAAESLPYPPKIGAFNKVKLALYIKIKAS